MLRGLDISRNAGEESAPQGERDPRIHDVIFPTVADLAFNLAIIYTLFLAVMMGWGPNAPMAAFSDTEGFKNVSPASFLPCAGCADKKRWYRQFSIHWTALWLQQAIILIGGVTLDLGMQSGQRSAVQTTQRRLSNILEIVYERVYHRVVVWSLWTPEGLRKDIDPSRCWDQHSVVHGWRQMRYEAAITKGCTMSEAVRAYFPFDKHGYSDDSLCPTISLFIDLLFEELLKCCDALGILLSIPKFHKADALGR